MQQSQPATKSYGVLDLLWDIRDAHSICKKDSKAKSILWSIASRSDSKKGFTCYPSEKLIAGDISASVRTVQRHLKLLLAEGLVKRTRRYDDSYIYCVCVDKIRTAAEKQRKLWSAEKETQSAGDEAFEKAVKANTTVSATPSSLAEDAALPEATSKTLDYTDTLAKGILNIEALAQKISSDEAQSFASTICRNHAGSAPVIALGRLTNEAISRAANAKTPCAYLRTVLAKKIDELGTEPYTKDESWIERFVDEMLEAKENGSEGFNIHLDRHPHWVDDRIAAIGRREGGILNSPYLATDEVGDNVLSFGWPDYTEPKEPTGDDDYYDADYYGPVDPPVVTQHEDFDYLDKL
jgi:hypothetical protein